MLERIFDLLDFQKKNFNNEFAVYQEKKGDWKGYSLNTLISESDTLALFLIDNGIKKGDTVACLLNNSIDWLILDFACQYIGAISVPIYTTLSFEETAYILKDSEAKIVFTNTKDLQLKIDKIHETFSAFKRFNFLVNHDFYWKRNLHEFSNTDFEKIHVLKSYVKKEDIVSFVYTSGTTGNSKGVMLSHQNILSNAIACKSACNIEPSFKALSFLPISHAYERMLLYLYMSYGVTIYFAENPQKIMQNIQSVKPDLMSSVPRILEKIYEGIYNKVQDMNKLSKLFFNMAIKIGSAYDDSKNGFIYKLKLKICDKLIYSKWREALGGNIKYIISGAAPLEVRLINIFHAAKINILEGYGLTETSPVIAVNFENEIKPGTVGRIVDCNKVKIADDGEILVKGSNVMMGYYKKEEEYKASFVDGWFKTGDIGELIDGEYLKITDRKKEIFKNSGGKYIAPQVIENKIKESMFIDQLLVVGEGQKSVAALIVPNFEQIKFYLKHNGINIESITDLMKHELTLKKIKTEIAIKNKDLSSHEKVKNYKFMTKPWTVETGEVTPTLKMKRQKIINNNQELIQDMFN